MSLRMPRPDGVAWADGRRVRAGDVQIGLDDPIVFNGLGLFETLAVREGAVLDLDEHLARLAASAAAWGWETRADDWRVALLDVADSLAAAPAWLRLLLAGSGRWFACGAPLEPDVRGVPARVVVLPWRRARRHPLTGCKSTSYADHVIGRRWANDRGADEGLWLNDRGHLTEGCHSNLFVVRRGRVFTASTTDGVLAGTLRARVLEVVRRRGCVIHEGRLRPTRLQGADEIWLSSSLADLRPVIEVDGRPVADGRPGPLFGVVGAEVAAAAVRTTARRADRDALVR